MSKPRDRSRRTPAETTCSRHCLYAEHGISQIDDLASLEVPPLSNIGTPVEIARLFGGSDAFHEAVRQLGDILYAA